jgi:O-methyltransferase involved in polyketide biosynthesis
MTPETDRISPTAHYTGYVWYRNGLSHNALMTSRGRRLFYSLHPAAFAYNKILHGPTLEQVLLRRHLLIDHLLGRAIESGAVRQVVEIAAGLSPRGYRFCQRFGDDLTYVEADLADMATLKRRILTKADLLGPNHHVVEMNALANDGPTSLTAVTSKILDPKRGTAIITEGLLNYFDGEDVRALWRRGSEFLSTFPHGVYLSDLHVRDESTRRRAARLFRLILEVYSRGQIHLHFKDAKHASKALVDSGFERATIHRPRDFEQQLAMPTFDDDLVRVIEATSRSSAVTIPTRPALH